MKTLSIGVVFLLLALSAAPLGAADKDYEPINSGASGQAGRRTPVVAAIEKARPAVVSVYALINTQGLGPAYNRSPFHDEFFNRFFSDMWRPRARQNTSLGSGVIIDGDKGLVVTNEHVVRGAQTITITLSDGRELPAEILGADPRFDLAVLKVENPKSLPSLKLGNSDELMIGETVIAIGNPFGFSHTATTGVISATGRTLASGQGQSSYHDLIQTDASINPGNSGGPLLNIDGDIIGLNTAILAQGEGLGFAIPASQIKRISARLMRGDKEISSLDLGLELAEAGRPIKGETGCLVVGVKAGGPAEAGGMRKGDFLMKLDGSPTSTIIDYEMIISSLTPGQSVVAEILRDDKPMTLTLRPKVISQSEALNLVWKHYGLKVLERQGHLVIERPADNSPADNLGLREGDYLLSFASREVKTRAELAKAMLDSRFQNSVQIAVQRGRTIYRATLSR